MWGWGIVAVIAFVMAVGIVLAGILVLRLHSVRRRDPELRTVQAALQEQAAALDGLLSTADNLNKHLARLLGDAGVEMGGSSGSSPVGEPSSMAPEPSKNSTPPQHESSEQKSWSAASRNQRSRQWDQVNVAFETVAHIVPEALSAPVLNTASDEILRRFNGSGVGAVLREFSRIEEAHGRSNRESESIGSLDRRNSLGRRRIGEKSIRPAIVEPRLWWDQERFHGEFA